MRILATYVSIYVIQNCEKFTFDLLSAREVSHGQDYS